MELSLLARRFVGHCCHGLLRSRGFLPVWSTGVCLCLTFGPLPGWLFSPYKVAVWLFLCRLLQAFASFCWPSQVSHHAYGVGVRLLPIGLAIRWVAQLPVGDRVVRQHPPLDAFSSWSFYCNYFAVLWALLLVLPYRQRLVLSGIPYLKPLLHLGRPGRPWGSNYLAHHGRPCRLWVQQQPSFLLAFYWWPSRLWVLPQLSFLLVLYEWPSRLSIRGLGMAIYYGECLPAYVTLHSSLKAIKTANL